MWRPFAECVSDRDVHSDDESGARKRRPFAECVSDRDVHSDDESGARKRKYLSQDAKQILLNIYNTLMEENNEGQTKNIQRTSQLTKVPMEENNEGQTKNIQRTSQLTKVPIGTIYKTIKNNAEPRKAPQLWKVRGCRKCGTNT
ncbi:hypothetical protein QE152_g15709 [Popillia japonica]|uniref:Uncharacterized protein n=1 Tax=Popillia japonica TaxID=7064 RepID=A0AAW1L7T5_POPJA